MATVNFPLTIEPVGADAAAASIFSIAEAIGASDALCELISDQFADLFEIIPASGGNSRFDLCLNGGDLLLGEAILTPADGAMKCILQPSIRYLELVAAVTRNGDFAIDSCRHGWPILSVAVAGLTAPFQAAGLLSDPPFSLAVEKARGIEARSFRPEDVRTVPFAVAPASLNSEVAAPPASDPSSPPSPPPGQEQDRHSGASANRSSLSSSTVVSAHSTVAAGAGAASSAATPAGEGRP